MIDEMENVPVLSVSPSEEDHLILDQILKGSPWRLYARVSLVSAIGALKVVRFSVILCDCELKPGSWRDLLEPIALLADPPQLIVTAPAPDQRLWVETMDRGAYDFLVKPFAGEEVRGTIASAWRQWWYRSRDRTLASGGGDTQD